MSEIDLLRHYPRARRKLARPRALDPENVRVARRFGKDYFDELLERIREIRASERRFYQKITDICTNDLSSICENLRNLRINHFSDHGAAS